MSYFWIDSSKVLWFHTSYGVDIRIRCLNDLDLRERKDIEDAMPELDDD
jgi:hypothetical protein